MNMVQRFGPLIAAVAVGLTFVIETFCGCDNESSARAQIGSFDLKTHVSCVRRCLGGRYLRLWEFDGP